MPPASIMQCRCTFMSACVLPWPMSAPQACCTAAPGTLSAAAGWAMPAGSPSRALRIGSMTRTLWSPGPTLYTTCTPAPTHPQAGARGSATRSRSALACPALRAAAVLQCCRQATPRGQPGQQQGPCLAGLAAPAARVLQALVLEPCQPVEACQPCHALRILPSAL